MNIPNLASTHHFIRSAFWTGVSKGMLSPPGCFAASSAGHARNHKRQKAKGKDECTGNANRPISWHESLTGHVGLSTLSSSWAFLSSCDFMHSVSVRCHLPSVC